LDIGDLEGEDALMAWGDERHPTVRSGGPTLLLYL